MKIVILSPHRDDAAFSLSLAIDAWLVAGHTVQVVNCFTRSEYAPFSDESRLPKAVRIDSVSELRKHEDERWRDHFGRGLTLLDLDIEDAPLRLGCAADQVCGFPVKEGDSAIEAIHSALVGEKPDALVLPLALGEHVDHMTARGASLDLANKYVTAFYEDLPYAGRPGAAEEIERVAEDLHLDLRPVFVSKAQNVPVAVAHELELAHEYESQVDEQVMDEIAEFSARYQGRERLWSTAAWRKSPLLVEEAPLVSEAD